MKTTIELPDELIKMVKIRAVNDGAKLKDLFADLIRKGLAVDAKPDPAPDQLARRRELGRKFDSGEWQVELTHWEESQSADSKRLVAQLAESEGKLRI